MKKTKMFLKAFNMNGSHFINALEKNLLLSSILNENISENLINIEKRNAPTPSFSTGNNAKDAMKKGDVVLSVGQTVWEKYHAIIQFYSVPLETHLGHTTIKYSYPFKTICDATNQFYGETSAR